MGRGLFGSLATGLRRVEGKAVDASALTWQALLGNQNSRAGVSVKLLRQSSARRL